MSQADSENFCSISVNITKEQVLSLLCSAFEGGSNYWASSVEETDIAPTAPLPDNNYWHWSQWNPVNGSPVIVTDIDGNTHTVNAEALRKGLAAMAVKCPHAFADAIAGTIDAETGDIFLQCCCFGQVVYA